MVTDLAVRGVCENFVELAHFAERINFDCYSCINIILRRLAEEVGTRPAKIGSGGIYWRKVWWAV